MPHSMDFKLLVLIYLYYLILDGIFHLFKIIAIIAEYGVFTTLRATVDLTTIYMKKPFSGVDAEWRIIERYTINSNSISFRPIYNTIRILVKPTVIIDNIGRRIALLCSFNKAAKYGLSFDNLKSAALDSQVMMGFNNTSNYSLANKLPILANALFIFDYHIRLLSQLFPDKVISGLDHNSGTLHTKKCSSKDIFGCSPLPKIIRLVSIEILIIFSIMEYISYQAL